MREIKNNIYLLSIYYKIKYFKENWKMVIHLLFGTYKFGVNNELWCSHRLSLFAVPWKKRFMPSKIRQRYEGMRFRAIACGFIPKDKAEKIFYLFIRKIRHSRHY
jgi:hypothetical protein